MDPALSSTSDCSSYSTGNCKCRLVVARPFETSAARRELKRSIEKKFRLRYASLQHAYEQRLDVLAMRMQEVMNHVRDDATIHNLKATTFTHESASARLGEIVHECFHGDRERYIKTMSDQIAWQASDLREAHQKLQFLQKRENDARIQWKVAQRDVQALHQQLTVRVKEETKQDKDVKARCSAEGEERDAARREIDELRQSVQLVEPLQQGNQALTRRLLQEKNDGRAVRSEVDERRKEASNKLELQKQASEQQVSHWKQLLMLSESKARDAAQALQKVQKENYPTKFVRLESDLVHHQQVARRSTQDHEDLKQRYHEFGMQVEQYMREQTQEKAALAFKGDKAVKELQTQLDTVTQQAQDAIKAKENERTRAMELLATRQDALDKAEKTIASLMECASVSKAQESNIKLQHETIAASLAKEGQQWRHALEQEQQTRTSLQQELAETKDKYERKIVAIQDVLTRQTRQDAIKKELAVLTRWQTAFVARQDAQLKALKKTYDSALQKQEAELYQARQLAVETANSAAAKWERAKLVQKEADERERCRRVEDADCEKKRHEEQHACQFTQKRLQQELDEREKRVMERERALLENERREERRRIKSANTWATSPPGPHLPSAVVFNVGSLNDESTRSRVDDDVALKVAARHCQSSETISREEDKHEASKPCTQHLAELQLKEAHAALRAEECVQKPMQEVQERKEVESRAAMDSLGIHKQLEKALEETQVEKKRVEEQLLNERQAFVRLTNEYEESKDAKQLIVQRLEEANENIDGLRCVVKDLLVQCQSRNEQCQSANARYDKAQAAFATAQNGNKELREQLLRVSRAAVQRENALYTSVESSEQSNKALRDRMAVLEHQIKAREEQVKTELTAIEEKNTRDCCNLSLQYDTHLCQLQATLDTTQLARSAQYETATQLKRSVCELNAAKDSLLTKVETMMAESVKHEKDFAELSRMHNTHMESITSRLEAASVALAHERGHRLTCEDKAMKAEKQAARVKRDQQQCVNTIHDSLRQLTTEWNAVRQNVASEMNVGRVDLQKKIAVASVAWIKWTDDRLQAAETVGRCKAEQDQKKWNQVMAENDKLLANQRVNDQAKYDQVSDRLATTLQELEELKRRLTAQVQINSDLRRTEQALKEDQKLNRIELMQVQARWSTATEQDTKEKEQVKAHLQSQRAMCEHYRVFYAALAKQSGTDSTALFAEVEESTWDPRQVSDELTQLATRLRETRTHAIQKAIAEATMTMKQGICAPVLSELETAQRTLSFLWSEVAPSGSNIENDGHFPWYVRAARAVKREREAHEQRVTALQRDLAAKVKDKKELIDRHSQWTETMNLLRFEKDTVLREMELLRQTLEKQKVQELQELQAESEARIKQQKQRHDRANLKSEQDHEGVTNELRDRLKAERRATSHAKDEVIELKMTLERTQEESREAQQILDKETDELRETASKWKRKAIKNNGSVLKAQTLHLLSSSLSLEEDGEASSRMLRPRSQRAPNAMTELSCLMEQSLVSIRNESMAPPTS